MKKILVAYDFSESSERTLAFAAALARKLGAEVALCHVHPDVYDGRADASLTLPAALPGQGERYMRFLEQELRTAGERALGARVEAHVRRGDPVTQMDELAAEIGADALCVGATGKGAVARVLLGSVSQALLRSARVPVLLVP